jgi:hypothetical protein
MQRRQHDRSHFRQEPSSLFGQARSLAASSGTQGSTNPAGIQCRKPCAEWWDLGGDFAPFGAEWTLCNVR